MRPRFLPLALIALGTACVPSTFDGLSGAKNNPGIDGLHAADPNKTDPTIAPPRLTSPLSTAYVNTSRPHFKWSLPAGTTGATVEISQTRDFANPLVKEVATGSDYTPTQDLPAGPWFWRLTGRSNTNPGENQSPVWLVYVRGPSALGASDTPHMGILDLNADGHPDIAVTMVAQGDDDDDDDSSANTPHPMLWITIADADGSYSLTDSGVETQLDSQTPVLAPVDVDGDGFGDLMIADVFTPGPNDPPDPPDGYIYPFLGGPDGYSNSYGPELFQQPFQVYPALAPGDFNGDGYGDVSVAFSNFDAAMLGNAQGGGPMMAFASAGIAPGAITNGARAITSGDFNGDGLSDVAFAPFDAVSPIRVANGGVAQFDGPTALTFADATAITRATAVDAGDFDGDGVDDVAFTTTVAGKNAVCVHGSTDGTFNTKACWISTTADATADFGLSLLTADMDGTDGKDEIIVVSKSGLIVLAHTGTGKGFTGDDSLFTPTPLVPAIKPATGGSVTVLYPGRPGPARWASYGADAKSFDVYNGTSPVQHADLSADPTFVSIGATIR